MLMGWVVLFMVLLAAVASAAIIAIALVRPKHHERLRASKLGDYSLIECSYHRLSNPPTHRSHTSRAHQLDHIETSVHGRIKSIFSKNLAGYVVAKDLLNPERNSVKSVSGAWTIPRLASQIGNGCAWKSVGVDGFNVGKARSMIRIGTATDWVSEEGQVNYAWFQVGDQFPMMIVNFPVNVGDSVGAEIQRTSSTGGQCRLTIRNNTRGVAAIVPSTFTNAPHAEFSTAMFLVEIPSDCDVLADVGAITFHDCICMIDNVMSTLQTKDRQSAPIHMTNLTDQPILSKIIAKTSSLSPDTKSFTITL